MSRTTRSHDVLAHNCLSGGWVHELALQQGRQQSTTKRPTRPSHGVASNKVGSSGFRVGFGNRRTRSGPGKGIALPRLPERPFRALLGGNLPEFLRPRLRATTVPQSVPAFHPGNASVGTPLLRRSQRSPLSPAQHESANPARVLRTLPAPRRASINLNRRRPCLVG